MNVRPKSAEGDAWGILNPYGDLWTHRTFPNEQAAAQHVKDFWRGVTLEKTGDLRRFKPVRVKVRVTVATPTAQEDT